ncbi:MAG: toll/interleukin-1 receptor domain-containing protein, partial [Deltaproteobacteria bacterium]|nr:toll/interleukin-1 receptor domain-containing protein [Deltaproteobacteria bacterium]
KDNYSEAIAAWNDVLTIDAQNATAKDGIKKAQKEIERISDLSTSAQQLYYKDNYSEAIAAWNDVLTIDAQNATAKDGIKKAQKEIIRNLNDSARQLYDDEKYSEAIDKWSEVLNLDPNNKKANDGMNIAKEKTIYSSDIFLSYKSEDKEKAQVIAKAIEQKGHSVWWARKFPPGKNFDDVIEEKLDAAQCVIVLWSKNSVKSEWVKEEAAEGYNRGILIPVLIDDILPPLGFRRLQTAKLIDWNGELSHPEFDLLFKSVANILSRSKVAKYLFRWDKIPGKDTGRLIDFLNRYFAIEWVKTAKIEKHDDDRAINVSAGKNYLSLSLNDEKTKVHLKIEDGRTYEFIVKMENNELNIYAAKTKKDGIKEEIDKIKKDKNLDGSDFSNLDMKGIAEHPDTHASMDTLAETLRAQGDLEGARKI